MSQIEGREPPAPHIDFVRNYVENPRVQRNRAVLVDASDHANRWSFGGISGLAAGREAAIVQD